MSKVEVKHPEKEVSTGAYPAGALIDGWLCVSGQGPLDLKTGNVVEGSIEGQTQLTLSHIGKMLEAGGCTFDDVVKRTYHLSDIRDFDSSNAVHTQFLPRAKRVRATVQSVQWSRIKVEVGALARVPQRQTKEGEAGSLEIPRE
jgi:2-iminobutanoate/2-iminopropanoate deaminase